MKKALKQLSSPEKEKIYSRFFKTGKGQYGEGDVFLGITVPEQRKVARKYQHLKLSEIQELLSSRIHEHRLTALFILIYRYNRSDSKNKKRIFDFYLKNIRSVNNWDLVDLSAYMILGDYIFDKLNHRKILYRFARSRNLWERRISIIATFAFIRKNRFEETLEISKLLLNDDHDLIHKAIGWMLREVGKRNIKAEERFLKENYRKMPRTMLRYAIERFPKEKKAYYLRK
ncbi:MAG: DNA alkylation repair protein [Nitrososphaerales archaeon]